MLTKNLIVVFFLLFSLSCFSQATLLPVITLDKKNNTDTVWINVVMSNNSKPSSLMVTCCTKESNICDTLFYPLVNVENLFEFTVPETYQNEAIEINCYYYSDIFQVAGVINNADANKEVEVFMITANDSNYNKTVKIDSLSRTFYLPKLVFEENASVFFNYVNGKKSKKPDVTIRQFPAATDFNTLVYSASINFSNNIVRVKEYDSLKNAGIDPGKVTLSEGKGKELSEIVVKTNRNARFQTFRKEFVSGRFSSTNSREFDCISSDEILNFYTCYDFLRNKVPSFRMTKDGSGFDVISWQWGNIGTFFIDEMEVYFEQIRYLDVNTVALIQLIPPTLVSPYSLNNSGSVLSVYTRKGKYARPGSNTNNWVFSVRGYTPDTYQLFSYY